MTSSSNRAMARRRATVLEGYTAALRAALEPGQKLGYLSTSISSGLALADLSRDFGYATITDFMNTLKPPYADFEEHGRNFSAYSRMIENNKVEVVERLAAIRAAYPEMLIITPTTLPNLGDERNYMWFWRELIHEFKPFMFLSPGWNLSAGSRAEVRDALDVECKFAAINEDLEINPFDAKIITTYFESSQAEFDAMYSENEAPEKIKYISSDAFFDKMVEKLNDTYDLMYVDYRDELSDEQLAKGVEKGVSAIYDDDGIMEWISDNKHESLCTISKEIFDEVHDELTNAGYDVEEFDESDFFDQLRELIEERDTSTPEDDLIKQTNSVLCRVSLTSIDYEDVSKMSASEILTLLKLPTTDQNIQEMQYAMDNSSAGYDGVYLEAHAVFMLDPSVLIEEDEDTKYVEVENPRIWLTNPYQGDGFMSGQMSGTIRFNRSKLRVDASGHGWSAADVFGISRLSDDNTVRFTK